MKTAFYFILLLICGCKIEEKAGLLKQKIIFCNALFSHSPTREEYIRNWQPGHEVQYCPEGNALESCQKKHDDAFQEGLDCYKKR